MFFFSQGMKQMKMAELRGHVLMVVSKIRKNEDPIACRNPGLVGPGLVLLFGSGKWSESEL
jgi:hypothetical protein